MRILTDFASSAFVCLMAIAAAPAASADEQDARGILRSMSRFLAETQSLGFDYDATLDVVTTEGQILGIATSGRVDLVRPDRFRSTRAGGYAALDITLAEDRLSVAARHAGIYAETRVTGGLDGMFDLLREEHRLILPGADLLAADAYEVLMSEVTDVKDLGAGMIRGQLCDHLAFRTPDVDWQIWIAASGDPYPCRFVIATHTFDQGPRYTLDLLNWQSDLNLAADHFAPARPDDLTAGSMDQIQAAATEFPDHFKIGETQ